MSDPAHEATYASANQEDSPLGATGEDKESTELVGQIIADRYRVEAVLGRGGMGAVLRCHHLGLKNDVAVKLLHPEMSRNPEVATRFEREAQSTSRLDHPNCVRVLDFGKWTPPGGDTFRNYLVMQLLEGQELRDLLRGALPPARAVDLVLQIICGLEHAHSRGIVHRDLKPENVFVTKDHEGRELLKLVDFGIAKIMEGPDAAKDMTRLGMVFGTPRYMSPEQAAGGRIDERTDVYAAGIIFYQMLSGRLPFDADDVMVVLRQQIAADVPPLPNEVPVALRKIVERMLAKDRDARYPDASATREALEAARAQLEANGAGVVDPSLVAQRTLSSFPSLVGIRSAIASLPTHAPAAKAKIYAAKATLHAAVAKIPYRHRRWVAWGGAGVMLLGLGLWVSMPSGSTDTEPAVVSEGSSWGFGTPQASALELEELDALIKRGPRQGALASVVKLTGEYPKDARLQWRYGRLLADAEEPHAALARYGEAAALDPALLDDEAFWGELDTLLNFPRLRAAAVAMAMEGLGQKGQEFLLARINDDALPLTYEERHTVLEKLADSSIDAKRIDQELNLALDLWQAEKTEAPCPTFRQALEQIAEAPAPYYLGSLHAVQAPAGDDSACTELGDELERVRNLVVERHPTPPETWTGPTCHRKSIAQARDASGKGKRKRWRPGSGLRRVFGG